jgi:hypothetical protein
MNDTQTVTVFYFQTLDDGVEMARMAGYKATREQIAAMNGAKLLEGTGKGTIGACRRVGANCRTRRAAALTGQRDAQLGWAQTNSGSQDSSAIPLRLLS